MNKYWGIQIRLCSESIACLGTEEHCRGFQEEWATCAETTVNKVMVFNGFVNLACRSPTKIAVQSNQIIAIDIWKEN